MSSSPQLIGMPMLIFIVDFNPSAVLIAKRKRLASFDWPGCMYIYMLCFLKDAGKSVGRKRVVRSIRMQQ